MGKFEYSRFLETISSQSRIFKPHSQSTFHKIYNFRFKPNEANNLKTQLKTELTCCLLISSSSFCWLTRLTCSNSFSCLKSIQNYIKGYITIKKKVCNTSSHGHICHFLVFVNTKYKINKKKIIYIYIYKIYTSVDLCI